MYPPDRMATPEPLPLCRPFPARTVTTDGSARFATLAAGHAAPVPAEPRAVVELPFPEPHVALTISPPAMPPTIAAANATAASMKARLRPPRGGGPPASLASSVMLLPPESRASMHSHRDCERADCHR